MDNIKVAGSGIPGAVPVITVQGTDRSGTEVQIPIYATSVTSVLNSSTTALDDTQVFTGDWEDVGHFNSVVVAVKTDQDGFFSVQFSPDGVNEDSSILRYYRTAHIEAPHRFTITRRYCRIVFTNNSGSNQTYFRLQASFGDKNDLSAPCDSTLSQDYDATIVRPTDYKHEVALGRRQGATLWNKFGYNSGVPIGTELLASQGGSMAIHTTASTYSFVSTSTADADGGTGCNSIVIYGTDANWDPLVEVLALNGTTPVVSAGSFISHPNRVAMYLCGTGQTNAGVITGTRTTGGATIAELPTGQGVTQQCVFTVARSQKFLAEWVRLTAAKLSGGGNPVVTFIMYVYSSINNGIQEVFRDQIDTQVKTSSEVDPSLPFPIGEKSIVWIEATSNSSNTSVTGRFSGIMMRDADH